MAECEFHETPNMYPNLSAPLNDEQQFRLNKINKIKNHFAADIKEREQEQKTQGIYGFF